MSFHGALLALVVAAAASDHVEVIANSNKAADSQSASPRFLTANLDIVATLIMERNEVGEELVGGVELGGLVFEHGPLG
eukprot:809258-Pyramimonas_sp.AAC.1